ncbi:MAG: Sigma 54 modulation protein YhbH [bacterium]|nr:Sigma 54 modulation protein YhbH [bacterium]
MQSAQISHHGLDPSPALTELIQTRAAQLEHVSDRIHSLRVLVDAPHQHHHKGNHYRVRIELTLPGRNLVVGNEDDARISDEDPYQAVRYAFDAVRRQLTRRRRARAASEESRAARATAFAAAAERTAPSTIATSRSPAPDATSAAPRRAARDPRRSAAHRPATRRSRTRR